MEEETSRPPDGLRDKKRSGEKTFRSSHGGLTVAGSASSVYPALPASAAKSGDYYLFLATALNSNNSGGEVFGSATSNTGGGISFTFPPPWTYAGPAPAALPRLSYQHSGFTGKTGVTEGGAILGMTTKPNGPTR